MGKKKNSSGVPFLDGLIDLAGGMAMAGIASKMESKYHYSKKGKINPYAASAFGIASGRLRSTDSLLRLGGALGASGSFDVEPDTRTESENERLLRLKYFTPEDPLFETFREASTNDNRFAWRLNCEDGTEYGIDPLSYSTYEAYKEALSAAKENLADDRERPNAERTDEGDPSSDERIALCRVSRLDNGKNQYYRIGGRTVHVGDIVRVPPVDGGEIKAVVLAIEEVELDTLSEAANEIPYIL